MPRSETRLTPFDGKLAEFLDRPYNWNGVGGLPARPEAITFARKVVGSRWFPGNLVVLKAELLGSGVPSLECRFSDKTVYLFFPTRSWVEWSVPGELGTAMSGRMELPLKDPREEFDELKQAIHNMTRTLRDHLKHGRERRAAAFQLARDPLHPDADLEARVLPSSET